jgi:hypothetical protein
MVEDIGSKADSINILNIKYTIIMIEKSRRIIHIAFDSIFLDYAINQFELVAPDQSNYLVDTPYTDCKLKFIKNVNKISLINFAKPENRKLLLTELKTENILIFHCINVNMVEIINSAPKNIKIVWLVWGGEFYSLPLFNNKLYQPYTSKILNQFYKTSLRSKIYKRIPRIHYLLHKLKNGNTHPVVRKIHAMNRINYAGIFIKQDYDLLKSIYNFNLKWLWFSYFNIDDTVRDLSIIPNNEKENILVGNSANPSNNHIDIFNLLKPLNLGTRKVICPLSYGNNINGYAEKVIEEGEKYFGNNFIPLNKFIELDKYNEILNSCNIVIMNHNRQQAVGNIITAILQGSKIFLNEENTVYKYLKEIGVIVFSIQRDLPFIDFSSLNENVIRENKTVLIKYLSKETVLEKTRELINELC